jgi:hypothetical protein
MTVHNLRGGNAQVDLRYERSNGKTLVAVSDKRGDLRVTVDFRPPASVSSAENVP